MKAKWAATYNVRQSLNAKKNAITAELDVEVLTPIAVVEGGVLRRDMHMLIEFEGQHIVVPKNTLKIG